MKPISLPFALVLFLLAGGLSTLSAAEPGVRPNILWIYVDDMSDWVGCYGHTAVPTPHIDSLAAGGVLFERAYMPSPVCSTTRSALITGAMQTTLGLHHHRTMIKKPLPEGVRTIPELFREAGYITFNEAKEDYNFSRDRALMYSEEFVRPGIKAHLAGLDLGWLKQLQGRPFFGQIQLKGGKIGGETGSRFPTESRVKPESVKVEPFYPDGEVFRDAVARHYEQIAQTDEQVGAILAALDEFKLHENTAVFFFTDHGSPLPRSKQFLYEEGLKVPLLVQWSAGKKALARHGVRRTDLVSGLDIPATSLALAGIALPKTLEGRNLFAEELDPRDHVIGARDRCGIAVDRIRTVRTERFRYLRNYLVDRALYQSQYRDGFATFRELARLHRDDKLTPLQASYHDATGRPAEELYDLSADPHQLVNLVEDPAHRATLERHRQLLADWEKRTGDQGRQPESKESLRLVYKVAKGKAPAPEFDFLRDE